MQFADTCDELSDYESNLLLVQKALIFLVLDNFGKHGAANELHDKVDTLTTHVRIAELAV